MLRSVKELLGYQVQAMDGELGKVDDFYFEDREWTIRYLVVDTGEWLANRKVLIYSFALEHPSWAQRKFPIHFSKDMVKKSPPIDLAKPVSRQQEVELFEYYKWMPYWGPEHSEHPPIPEEERAEKVEESRNTETHSSYILRSFNEVKGYSIHAQDGDIGHLEDLIVDDDEWELRYFVVDTRNWMPAKQVLLAIEWANKIQWMEKKFHVDLPKEVIKESPDFDSTMPVNREFEIRLYDYYGRPAYWENDWVQV